MAWLSSSRKPVYRSLWLLMAHRLKRSRGKKASLNQKSLPYPQATHRAAAGTMQRHVPDSITTLRFLLARQIANQLDRCPCGCPVNPKLRL
jgi:hypothetical protein